MPGDTQLFRCQSHVPFHPDSAFICDQNDDYPAKCRLWWKQKVHTLDFWARGYISATPSISAMKSRGGLHRQLLLGFPKADVNRVKRFFSGTNSYRTTLAQTKKLGRLDNVPRCFGLQKTTEHSKVPYCGGGLPNFKYTRTAFSPRSCLWSSPALQLCARETKDMTKERHGPGGFSVLLLRISGVLQG